MIYKKICYENKIVLRKKTSEILSKKSPKAYTFKKVAMSG